MNKRGKPKGQLDCKYISMADLAKKFKSFDCIPVNFVFLRKHNLFEEEMGAENKESGGLDLKITNFNE